MLILIRNTDMYIKPNTHTHTVKHIYIKWYILLLINKTHFFFNIKYLQKTTLLPINRRELYVLGYGVRVSSPVTSDSEPLKVKEVQWSKIKLTPFWKKLFMQFGYWDINKKQNPCCSNTDLSNTYLPSYLSSFHPS